MINKWTKGVLALSLAAAVSGCSEEVAKEEMQKYNMEAYEEGNHEAKIEGRTMNGKFLETMQGLFQEDGISLTNGSYSEDDQGGMVYQYRIDSDSNQILKLHIFANEEAREKGIQELYGENDTTADSENLILDDKEAALVYTSAGDEKGKYTEQVKKVAEQVFAELPRESKATQELEHEGTGEKTEPTP